MTNVTPKGVCSVCKLMKKLNADGSVIKHGTCKGSRKAPSLTYDELVAFKELIQGQPEDSEPPTIENLWDVIKVFWPALHGDEGILVKGTIIVETVAEDGYPNLIYFTSPYMSSWDVKGMATHVLQSEASESTAKWVVKELTDVAMSREDVENGDDFDDDDIEDEQ